NSLGPGELEPNRRDRSRGIGERAAHREPFRRAHWDRQELAGRINACRVDVVISAVAQVLPSDDGAVCSTVWDDSREGLHVAGSANVHPIPWPSWRQRARSVEAPNQDILQAIAIDSQGGDHAARTIRDGLDVSAGQTADHRAIGYPAGVDASRRLDV